MIGGGAIAMHRGNRRIENVFVVVEEPLAQFSYGQRLEREGGRCALSQLQIGLGGDNLGFPLRLADLATNPLCSFAEVDPPRPVVQKEGDLADANPAGANLATGHALLLVQNFCTNFAPSTASWSAGRHATYFQ